MKILDSFYALIKPDWVILDLGAGAGRQAKFMTGLGARVIAVDSQEPKEGGDLVVWNILSIEEWVVQLNEDDVFDAILARNIFQFFTREIIEKKLFPILSKHLKSGGFFAIETFHKEPVPAFEHSFSSLWSVEDLKKNFVGWEVIASAMEEENTTDLSGNLRDFYTTSLLLKKP